MPDPRALPFDQSSEPLAQRVAAALHKLGLAVKHQAWVAASEEGLSPTQGQILAAVALDGPLTGSALASRLGVTLPTISDAVGSLVAKGLLVRRPDPHHPRARLLAFTPAGRRQATQVRAWPEFLAAAAGSLSSPEQESFLTALLKTIRALQEQGQIPVSRMCVTCVHFRPRVHQGPLPHHCALVDAPLADRHLRVECAEHEEAPAAQRGEAWARFTSPAP